MDSPRVGAFRLLHPISSGGMGEVWRGAHADSGLPVAIKLIRPDLVDASTRWEFEREIRFQARLEHPGIVYLYDHGELTPEAAAALGAEATGPWVAMEYCSRDLATVAADLNWAGTRSVLLQLLDALSHAHACGLLHRDIKIANVLVSDENDVRPGVKLADFGIAHVLADTDETTRSVGTPRYMAPEQVAGDWEDHGPWTDLYALGVMAWRLVTGRKPYQGLHGANLALAMMRKPLGWPGCRFDAPPGLQAWIERMTAKAPRDRFQLAADAAQELQALPPLAVGGVWMPTGALTGTLIPTEDLDDVPAPRQPVVRPMDDPPPESEANIRMHTAGLALLALRRPALIGRREERVVAWRHLRTVAKRGRPVVLSVMGPPRVGRTRFGEWLGEAAERTGQGVSLAIRCIPGRDFGDQVVQALRLWFRVGSRSISETVEHLESWLGSGPWVSDTAAMLVHGSTRDRSWQPTIAQALAALGRLRPLVLRLEGTERVIGVPAFVAQIQAIEHAPVLVVVDRDVPDAVDIRLGPMSDAAMHRLSEALVGLDPDVRARLVARAGGSPGFLVQTLIHWATHGQLLPGPKGFSLRDPSIGLAPTLAVVSMLRLEAVARRIGKDGLRSLQRAALLGTTVDAALWARIDGADLPDRVATRERVRATLLKDGLVEDRPEGFRFTSVPFREAVIAGAGDLSDDHRRCAEALAERARPGDGLELGRHLLAAGDVQAALEPLARGSEYLAEREGGASGLAALVDLERAVEQVEGPAALRWRAMCDQLKAGFLATLRELDAAEEAAQRALHTAEILGDDGLAARSWAALGAIASSRLDMDAREAAYRRALDLGRDVPPSLRARWWVALAKSHLARGNRDAWARCMAEAGECSDSTAEQHIAPMGRAVVAQTEGRFVEALAHLDEAYERAAEVGSGQGRLVVLRTRAHTLLEAGRTAEARAVFREALELALTLRSPRAAVVLANAVAVELRLERKTAAADLFERHRFLLPAGGDRAVELVPLHCAGLAVATLTQNWRHARYHLERIREHGPWSWASLSCTIVCATIAAETARKAGRIPLADDIVGMARDRVGAHPHPDLERLSS